MSVFTVWNFHADTHFPPTEPHCSSSPPGCVARVALAEAFMDGSEPIPPDPTFIVGNNGSMQDPSAGNVASGDALSAAAPNPAGTALTAADLVALEARWIDRTVAERARLRRVDSLTGGELVGRKRGDFGGIAIPYFMPGSARVRDYRLRRDQPDLERDRTGQLKTKQKYLSPPGRGNMLYIPPGVGPGLLKIRRCRSSLLKASLRRLRFGGSPTGLQNGLALFRSVYRVCLIGVEPWVKRTGQRGNGRTSRGRSRIWIGSIGQTGALLSLLILT
jgi:hypothetical protein